MMVMFKLFYVQFAGFMGIGMIIMLIFGIVVVVMRNKVIILLIHSYLELVVLFLYL